MTERSTMQETSGRIPFVKMTGTGNDFILIDNRDGRIDANRCGDLVRFACRRKFSVGADGMILIENDPEVDFKWRFFNADGSEAEMCGNGSRCAARFAQLKGIVQKPVMSFRTLAGVIRAEMTGDRPRVRMTTPHGMETDIRLESDGNPLHLQFINTGVPHAVLLMESEDALESADVFDLGRFVRRHEHFQPAGTNVNFVFIRDPHHLVVRTYERGVEDETLACGTGSIASALIAAAGGGASSPVEVRTRSGDALTIHFSKIVENGAIRFDDVYLEGDARVVYEAELWDETLRE